MLVLTSDGKLHSLYVSNGAEPDPPVQFVPPNAHAHGLIAYDNTAYVATANGCGGVDNGVWALDLATKKVTRWKSTGGGVAGTAGPAVGPDGTLYAAGGGELQVNALVESLGWPQPQVSKHLAVLRQVGLVSVRRQGRERMYCVNGEALKPIHDWAKTFERFWTHQLDRIKQRAEQAVRDPAAPGKDNHKPPRQER